MVPLGEVQRMCTAFSIQIFWSYRNSKICQNCLRWICSNWEYPFNYYKSLDCSSKRREVFVLFKCSQFLWLTLTIGNVYIPNVSSKVKDVSTFSSSLLPPFVSLLIYLLFVIALHCKKCIAFPLSDMILHTTNFPALHLHNDNDYKQFVKHTSGTFSSNK